MPRLKTAAQAEREVLNYLIKESKKGYHKKFNPFELSTEGIAENLNIYYDDVEEALKALSGDVENKEARIESLKSTFKIWIPLNDDGLEIKDVLCESGVTVTGNLNVFYSFLIVLIGYIVLFEYPGVVYEDISNYFFMAVIITAASVPAGKYIAHRWYQLTLFLRPVKWLKYFVYGFVALAVLGVYLYNNGYDLLAIITAALMVIEVAIVFIQAIVNRNGIKTRN